MNGQMSGKDGEFDVNNGDFEAGKKEQEFPCSSTPRSDRLGRAKSDASGLYTHQAHDSEVRELHNERIIGGSATMSSDGAAAEQSGSKMEKALVGKLLWRTNCICFSRNPLATASKDDNDDSGSEFAEEFCMIAGSHSSTLDRMYAWERKLYDEVKILSAQDPVYESPIPLNVYGAQNQYLAESTNFIGEAQEPSGNVNENNYLCVW